MRPLVRVATLLAVVLVTDAQPTARQDAVSPPSPIDAVFARYVSGDRHVFQQSFATEGAYRAMRSDLFQRTRDWRQQWTAAGPTFMLELAAWGLEQSWVDSAVLLRTAGDIVVRRTAPLGSVPDQDRFEVEFHRAVLSLLSGQKLFGDADRYLDMVALRVVPAAIPGDARLVDPRLSLTRALLVDLNTAPGITPDDTSAPRESAPGGRTVTPLSGALKQSLERSVAAYEPLLAIPELADEARVRRAFALHRLGRESEALTLLSAVSASASDPVIQYWRQLFSGRVLDAMDRTTDAAAAYQQAAAAFPGSQTPALALAVLFQRQGDVVQAQHWAGIARSGQTAAPDPWLQYWAGDLRFYPTWVADLRKAH